jgi:hypothetical protein
MAKYQTFAGVNKGVMLTDEEADYIANTILNGSQIDKERAAHYLKHTVRTWVRYTTEDDYTKGKQFADFMKEETSKHGCD